MKQAPTDIQGQLPLEPRREAHFDGATYSPERDQVRLTGQLGDVWAVMRDGKWRGLFQLQVEIMSIRKGKTHSEAGLSARLRDLRKPQFGGHTVERRHVFGGRWEYRVVK